MDCPVCGCKVMLLLQRIIHDHDHTARASTPEGGELQGWDHKAPGVCGLFALSQTSPSDCSSL